jgi:hypothetical protein
MRFFHRLIVLLALVCINFNYPGVHFSETKNFSSFLPTSFNVYSLKQLSYSLAFKSIELAKKHQTAIFSTLSIVTLSLLAYIPFTFFKTDTKKSPTTEIPIDDKNFSVHEDSNASENNQRYYISPSSYFLLSGQISAEYPYGLALFENNNFIEKITINKENKTVLEHYMQRYFTYQKHVSY